MCLISSQLEEDKEVAAIDRSEKRPGNVMSISAAIDRAETFLVLVSRTSSQ